MTIEAILFDLDGTLLDTNDAHVRTWAHAFASEGYRVGRERIERAIGKGGDLLVSDLLGHDAEQLHGERLRAVKGEAYHAELRDRRPELFFGARALLGAARKRGLKTAIATSSDDLDFVEGRLVYPLTSLVDEVATANDVETSKPAPDIFLAAAKKLGVDPLACMVVGDSLHDAAGARRAGAAFVGVASGYVPPRDFEAEGARFVARDAAALASRLDAAIRVSSRLAIAMTPARLEGFVDEALADATTATERGGLPFGAAVFDANGEPIAHPSRSLERGELLDHPELSALRALGVERRGHGLVLASVVEPCVMCMGAAMELGIDVVVWALDSPLDGGAERVAAPRAGAHAQPRRRGGVRTEEARALLLRHRGAADEPGERERIDTLLDAATLARG